MKDLQSPLKSAYISLLASLGISAYEAGAVPSIVDIAYVVISDIATIEKSNKSDFGHKTIVLLDVIGLVPKNKIGGSKNCDLLVASIKAAINSNVEFPISQHFQSVNLKILSDGKLNGSSSTHRIYRRFIRIEQTIMQVK